MNVKEHDTHIVVLAILFLTTAILLSAALISGQLGVQGEVLATDACLWVIAAGYLLHSISEYVLMASHIVRMGYVGLVVSVILYLM